VSKPLLHWTISDSAMLSAAMRSGVVASRQKEQRRRQQTRARRLPFRTHAVTRAAPPAHAHGHGCRSRVAEGASLARRQIRDPPLASERLVDLASGPTGNNGADWKLQLETTLILETSVSAYRNQGSYLTITRTRLELAGANA
jgi:hypothetical protein